MVRMPKAYPYYDIDYAANVETSGDGSARMQANVFPGGRNGMHRYNNQDHSMYTAMLTVDNLSGASHDVWSVNVEEEYHETSERAPASGGNGSPPTGTGASGTGASGTGASGTGASGTGRDAPVLPKPYVAR